MIFKINNLLKPQGIKLMEKQFIYCFWQIKKILLLALFGFVGSKMTFTIGKSTTQLSHFSTYKSNANTTYLCTKLLKTVTVNFLKSNDNRKVSDGIVNVVKDSGEGRYFL